MEITKEKMREEFGRLVHVVLGLAETYAVCSRQIVILKGDGEENIRSKVSRIVEKNYHDRYSDIDVHVGVRLSPYGRVGADAYMGGISRYGFGSDACLGIMFVPENRLWRIVTRSGMRYDLGLDICMDDKAPVLDREFFGDGQGLKGIRTANMEEKNGDKFWFVQVQALGKLYRNDFLISDHLANMNLNETLVLQMVMRDIQQGTTHHRYGYSEELEYRNYLFDLEKHPEKCPYHGKNPVFNAIANKLLAAGAVYDKLAKMYIKNYRERNGVFRELWDSYGKA